MINGLSQRDVFSLKGKPALGTKFITPFQENGSITYENNTGSSYDPGVDQIDIVATEDNTLVKVTASKACVGISANTETPFTLMKGQTLKVAEIQASKQTNSLAGSTITADKPIAVTMTEDCIHISGNGSTDVAGDQIVPVEAAGTRYVIIRGESSIGERIDFTATKSGTTVTVYYTGSGGATQSISHTITSADSTWHIDMTTLSGITDDKRIYVQASAPVYAYQHSAIGGELGAAIIPSMFSISQKQIAFYASSGTNYIFLVFKTGKASSFQFQYYNDAGALLTATAPTVTGLSIPFPSGLPGSDWEYAKVHLNNDNAGKMVMVTNNDSPFSLGYFNTASGTAGYGYLSGFGSSTFLLDTVWRCPSCAPICYPIKLVSPVPMAMQWDWYMNPNFVADISDLDTRSVLTSNTGNDTLDINTVSPPIGQGVYWYIVDKDGTQETDTCYIVDMVFDANLNPRIPAKPAKVTVPQVFTVDYGAGSKLPSGITAVWNPDGGQIVSSDKDHAKIIWSTTGLKHVQLTLSATGPGDLQWTPDPVVGPITCDTVLVYDVLVHEKNIGFFVDQNVPYENEHNGTSWDNAFPTLQQALALASQGDFIWVADGVYSPHDSLPAGDSAMVYTGYYMKDNPQGMLVYDSLSVFTGSYVMDWDSVQVFGGFSGYGDTAEDNLAERNTVDNPTILLGDGQHSVVKIDGSTAYLHLGPYPFNAALSPSGVGREARWDGLTITGGVADYGAGVLFENGASGTISNAIIKGNAANYDGGGVYFDTGASPLIYGVEVSGNTAKYGAGLYNSGSNALLVNVTVSGNLASESGGGWYNAGGDPNIRNTIIYGNRASKTPQGSQDVAISYGTPLYNNSDIGSSFDSSVSPAVWNSNLGTDGGGNVDASPSFYKDGFSEKGYMVEGDYRLKSVTRLVVNTGYNYYIRIPYPSAIVLNRPTPANTSYADVLTHDLAGGGRVYYDYVDMGAYECLGETGIPDLTYSVIVPSSSEVIFFPPTGVYRVPAGYDFTLTITPREDYDLDGMRVSSGSQKIDQNNGMEVIANADGSQTVIVHRVVDQVKFAIGGVRKITSSEAVVVPSVWTSGSLLYVSTPTEGELSVYTVTGSLFTRRTVGAGTTSVALPAGVYVVTFGGGERVKVVVQ
ncbi:MAG: hypothetical protein LBR50_00080 [Tannerella sp.]|nr:hypothetical protein [Tannerella sp.]